MLDRLRDNAETIAIDFVQHTHGMRLAGPCLTVNEVGAIVAVQDAAD